MHPQYPATLDCYKKQHLHDQSWLQDGKQLPIRLNKQLASGSLSSRKTNIPITVLKKSLKPSVAR
jgi:hypothetical protein